MDLSSVREFVTGAYKGSPTITALCIYAIFLILAVLTHRYVQHLAQQPDAAAPTPTTSTVIQQGSPKDSTCSNIAAGGDANVNCPQPPKAQSK